MYSLKKFNLFVASLVLMLTLPTLSASSQEIKQNLKSFSRIIVSPRINLILEKGERENIRMVYDNVSEDKINIEVSGHTLRLYLDDAKVAEKPNPHTGKSPYHDATLTAYVTYTELDHLEIRGNQELTCKSPLLAERFTLKAYGENEISLYSLKTDYFRTSLYGENDLYVKGGKAEFQKYKLFGDNKINTQDMKSYSATATIYGESKILLTTHDNLRVNAFGESKVSYSGDANVNKGLIFGHTEIHKVN
jgi:hypothetical protein